jgi:pyrimidine-nucleoside phosphorylase
MRAYDIICRKRDKGKLTEEEIEFLISGYTSNKIPDYQMSALLMAIFLNGMGYRETYDLTLSMMRSGEVLDLSSIPGIKVDKHSTGGVGDKVSLVLAPLVAACGVKIPMISGRGLGHTGGTLDKLESIPGFKTNLTLNEFKRNLSKIGVCIMGQTEKIAPADKKIYALRDVTGTVDSIPLIVSSILSKKLASGVDAVVFDVKCGNGAFMQTEEKAKDLAKALIQVGKKMKKKMVALITDMNEPLGEAVGNSLEVIESIEALKGRGPEDLMEVTLALGSQMLILSKKAKSLKEAEKKLVEAIKSGAGLKKFEQMIRLQGGNPDVIHNYDLLPRAKYKIDVKSDKEGYVKSIQTKKIGLACCGLGAGRDKVDDKIDPAVGFLIKKKRRDYVKKGELIAFVFANEIVKGRIAGKEIKNSYKISKKKIKKLKKILNKLRSG